MSGATYTREEGERFVARMCDLFEANDREAFMRLWTPDCEIIDTATSTVHSGWAALNSLLDGYRTSFSDLGFVEKAVYTDPSGVITFRHVMRGRQTGPFRGLDPSGLELTWTACSIYALEPTRQAVRTEWFFYDQGSLLDQLSSTHTSNKEGM